MINFDNETENFESVARKSLSPLHFLAVRIYQNKNSKRMNVPQILRLRFIESDVLKFYYAVETGNFYIDFRPNEEDIVPEGVDVKDVHIIKTGRGYFITLPNRWFKHIQPIKASLTQLEEKRTVYKVQFYDNDK